LNKIDQRTETDCLRCCIAMVLDLEYEGVPDFVADNGPFWPTDFEHWARCRGYRVLRLSACGDGEMLPRPLAPDMPDGVAWIASGPAERGRNHAVVYAGTKPWHDPHPSRAGLLSITTATILVRC
jgi:hypothetical protein